MEGSNIVITHINIRQSITVMLARLIFLDLITTSLVIGIYAFLVYFEQWADISSYRTFLFLFTFGIFGVIKIFLNILVVLKWLNEYYEITPEYIYQKSGIFFRKTHQYRIEQIRRIEVKRSLLGQLFNFATIVLFDTRLNKSMELYLIHNPNRYAAVLKQLKPTIETELDQTTVPFLKNSLDVYQEDEES